MSNLFTELRRRNVFRVGVAYLVAAWLVMQVADTILDAIEAPAWIIQVLMLALALGFLFAAFFAWAFEVTPEGLKRESEVDRSQSITHVTGRKLDRAIMALLVIALVYFVWESRFSDRTGTVETAEVTEAAVEAPKTADTENRISIAVLPFDNRSSREDDEYFTEGIHDDLLTTIAKIGSMRVISRTSVMQYRNTTRNIREIAGELGVANILEGGIQRAGDHVRINVQLIDAATDEHLWAEIYDRELTAENLFAIQSEITTAIADALRATLSPEEQAKVNDVGTENLEAYESYLLGRKFWRERTAESNARAVEQFQSAVELDPSFALAWVGLSDAYRFSVYYEGAKPQDALPLAEQAINTALAIDDSLGEAYAARGALNIWRNREDAADADFRRALELAPNYAETYNWYAILLDNSGRIEEAITVRRRGLELDPLSLVLHNNLGGDLEALGRFDEARAVYERMLEIDPDSRMGPSALSLYSGMVRGRIDDAILWQGRTIANEPSSAQALGTMAAWYVIVGDIETATAWLGLSESAQPDSIWPLMVNLVLSIRESRWDDAEIHASQAFDLESRIGIQDTLPIGLLRDVDISNGRYAEALDRYEQMFPEITLVDAPEINRSNFMAAIDLAYLLQHTGDDDQAEKLLDAALEVSESLPLVGGYGRGFGGARAAVLQGDFDAALDELERAINAGWRFSWFYDFDYNRIFEPLRQEPRFMDLRSTIVADMAAQLERVRELEANGEVPRPEDLRERN